METIEMPIWPYAYGEPVGQGILRRSAQDFVVSETLAFEPSGSGEHVFLKIQKTDENTEYIARYIARYAGVRQRDIGYAGLKDRHAVTTQWFSVWLPRKTELDWTGLASETCHVLQVIRHARKLKRGVLAANHFEIYIRDWQGDVSKTEERLALIKEGGVPNYFGVQRFGLAGQNVNKAVAMFQGLPVKREQRSLYLSAARAYLFNQVLAERVRQDNWRQALAGDALMLAGSHSYFLAAQPDQALAERIQQHDLHPTGPLWGMGEAAVTGAAQILEVAALAPYNVLLQGLLQEQVEMARRALRVMVTDLEWQLVAKGSVFLQFSLPPGCYATAVLREIMVDC